MQGYSWASEETTGVNCYGEQSSRRGVGLSSFQLDLPETGHRQQVLQMPVKAEGRQMPIEMIQNGPYIVRCEIAVIFLNFCSVCKFFLFEMH